MTGDREASSEVAAFYDEYGEREWERLDRDFHHRLEWEATVEYLERYLPESGRVLDAGGAAGRYTLWLAERGHDVTLLDVSGQQVELARGKAVECELTDRVRVARGDVRALPVGEDDYDATLCLGGPLSHVLDAGARRTAAGELRRATVPGGPVFVSVMGLLASVTRVMRAAGRIDPERDETELLPALVRTGDYDADLLDRFDREPTMAPMHLFRAAEFESLLESAGLEVRTLAALEGPFSQRREELDLLTDAHREVIRETLVELREDRCVVDHSAHMLAVCRT
jgi:SAM-dependent methyltransferase